MLDKILRKLGYVPASALHPVPDDVAQPAEPPRALHQLSADAFDYERASGDSLCFWHEDGDDVQYALGRDDWVPIAVAGFCLTANRQCRTWLDDHLRARTWATPEIIDSWRLANSTVLDAFGSGLDERISFPSRLHPTTGIAEQDTVPFVPAVEMAELFALMWQRAHLVSPFLFLANSDPYVTLHSHHVLRSVHQANEHATERAVAWLSIWLEARGLTVDRKLELVRLPGYQPLSSRSYDEMWP
ncbi:hypothetical protein P0D88_47620 [Paraburkholderia sp. RL18-103-BIB-C]|uniref:hypothetical protein n=1 Tax=Paraburkholderia sp. RL18-103-BIB-C TaxID=3031637 RepID=UPI0038BD379A